jgi:hypothetical protein
MPWTSSEQMESLYSRIVIFDVWVRNNSIDFDELNSRKATVFLRPTGGCNGTKRKGISAKGHPAANS